MTPHALIAPARLAGIPLLRTQTDERLVDLVRAGNEAAFEAIVARYQRPLMRYCARFLSQESADDAVQQVFVRAYDALRSSDADMNLRPWLYRIAHNTALNSLRDRAPAHEQLSEQIDGVERPDQAFEKSQRLREVVGAVGMLPDRQRDALVLRELEGRSYDEIAASIGVSNGAVRQLLNRARITLRAGATVLTPYGLLARVPWHPGGGADTATRVAELCGGTAGGAVLAKVCVTALVTGAVLGGVAATPDGGEESTARPAPQVRGPASGEGSGKHGSLASPNGTDSQQLRRASPARGSRERNSERTTEGGLAEAGDESRGLDTDDHSGPGGGDDGSNSGPGSGSDRSGTDDSENSGPGSESSGPGSAGSDSDDSGSGSSGSGTSGSGSGTSGSGSGTSESGSGSSGTGSGGSDSTDTSGSGESGSGRSGSDLTEPALGG
jgi:RNA polymerase sigma factor (sigma-70 family)